MRTWAKEGRELCSCPRPAPTARVEENKGKEGGAGESGGIGVGERDEMGGGQEELL